MCVCLCPSHLAGFGVRGHLSQPCFMADINPGASGHEARLDCKRGGGRALSSPPLRASADGTVPDKRGAFESSAEAVCKAHVLALFVFLKQLYVSDRQSASYRQ